MGKSPNFLFLFSDQHRGDWMPYDTDTKRKLGVEKLELDMPNIRGIMDRGTAFSCAISPAPICAPARACLASGRRYKNCRVYSNNVNFDAKLETFYGKLQNAGYFVSGTGKFDLNKADLDWGDGYHPLLQKIGFSDASDSEGKMDTIWAAVKNQPGPYGRMLKEAGWLEAHVEDMLHRGGNTYPTPLPDELYADNWITKKSTDIIEKLPKDSPWFLQVNFSGPHDPWDITKKMKDEVSGRKFPDAAACTIPGENQQVRQNYASMIENIDSCIGKILEKLKKHGDLENTIVVYAADHGEMMGDHDLYGKAKPEQGSIHIPLVIDASYFGGKQGICNHTPIELQDLAATFLDYAGIVPKDSLESLSLKPILDGKKERVREYGISELINPNQAGLIQSFGAITDGKLKLIMRVGAADRLYDLSEDPFEENDIAAKQPEEVQRLRKAFGERGQKLDPAVELYIKSFHA
ncbi:MAG TPA: sulfatase-like hydrolase/transferase [Clostridiales bacterium]|nr:sulfatase-like hydrolase/transferase [Clostridiales bacterium]